MMKGFESMMLISKGLTVSLVAIVGVYTAFSILKRKAKDFSRVIKENLPKLVRCTNVNAHITALLRSGDGLTAVQQNKIVEVGPVMERCTMLYNWMIDNTKLYECFLQVMEANYQEHVANLLKGTLEEPHVPLSDERYHRLDKIKPKLMFAIYFSEALLSDLQGKKALSITDCEDIRHGKPMQYEKNFMLLGAIQRRSNYSFQCLEGALRETHQEDIADYLLEGLVIPLHVNTDCPEHEPQLSELVNGIIRDPSSDDAGITELRLQGIHPVTAMPNRSILFLFYCKTTCHVVNFTELFNSGRLTQILKHFFNRLLNYKAETIIPSKQLEINLRLDEEEVLMIEEFTGLFSWFKGENKDRRYPHSFSGYAAIKRREMELLQPKFEGSEKHEALFPYVRTIEQNLEVLQRCTDVNDYVIACLRAENVIDLTQELKLNAQKSIYERITLLYKWLMESQDVVKYENFLRIMEQGDVGQQHIANLLKGNFEENQMPMSEARYARLVRIRPKLTHGLSGLFVDEEFLLLLRLSRAISDTEFDEIESLRTGFRRSYKTITAIMRRSNKAFDLFKEALIETKQYHLAAYLDEHEMPLIHVSTIRPDLDDSLSEAFKSFSITEDQKLLSSRGGISFHPVIANPGK